MIEEHLECCGDCRITFEEMKAPVREETEEEKKEIDFLKKIRKCHKRLIMAISAVSLLMAAVVFSIAVKLFVIGSPVDPNSLSYECSYNEETKELTIHGTIGYRMTEYLSLIHI